MPSEWSIPFVGREEELTIIREHLQAWGTRRVIFIAGGGGIGKTRLLNEVVTRFSNLPNVSLKTPAIIDFDDDRYKFRDNVKFALARQIDVAAFSPYFETFHDLRLAEERWGDANMTMITRKALAVDRDFIENFNNILRDSRVLLRFDTTDAISLNDPLTLKYLFDMVMQLENIVLIVAGRNADEIYEQMRKDLGREAVLIQLKPFAIADSRAYLEHKQQVMKVAIPDIEWLDKLFILAGGLPVLIDLAIEWAQIRRPLKGLESLSLSELQSLAQQAQSGDDAAQERLQDLRDQFTCEVVMPTAHLRTRLDHLKLLLAKVYPLDLDGIMEMLDINRIDAEQLLERAGNSVAIKRLPDGRFKLHDEVQRLINKYVWKSIDPQQEWEQRDSRRAVEYLTRKSQMTLEEIHRLKEREGQLTETSDPSEIMTAYEDRREKEIEFWSLRVERLRRQLKNDVARGYTMFQEDYDLSRVESSSFHHRGTLLSIIEPYADLEKPETDSQEHQLSASERWRIQEAIALEERYSGMYDSAARRYEKLRAQIAQNSEEYLAVLNGQANLWVRAGKLQDALNLNEQVVHLSQEQGSVKWEIESEIEIGWVHRLMGHLDMAQQHYGNALRLAMQHDDEERIADLYSSMAYVHALQHQGRALSEVQRSIAMWQEMVRHSEGLRHRLGRAYNVAGEVCLELIRPEEASTYFELSWNIFELEEAQDLSRGRQALEWKSKSRSGRGFAYWHLALHALEKGNQQVANNHLTAACADLEWATEHAAPFDDPIILNRLGEVYFLMKRYPETIKVWLQSMDGARQIGDAFTELHGLSDLARVAFYDKVDRFPTWQDFETHYNRDYRRRHPGLFFEILHGLFHTYLGHLALQAEHLDDAKRLYESGLSILAQTGTYGGFNLTGQLAFIETDILPKISPETARKLGETLLEIWMTRSQDITALAYFREWIRWENKDQQGAGE